MLLLIIECLSKSHSKSKAGRKTVEIEWLSKSHKKLKFYREKSTDVKCCYSKSNVCRIFSQNQMFVEKLLFVECSWKSHSETNIYRKATQNQIFTEKLFCIECLSNVDH